MSATITLYKVAEGVRWVDDHWSDNKDHDTFDFLRCGRRNFGRCRRPRRYMDLAKGHYGEHIQYEKGLEYLVLDKIMQRQGWFFRKKLFKCGYSIFWAFNKDDAMRLLKRMIKVSDERGREAYNVFLVKLGELEDGEHIIFQIAW